MKNISEFPVILGRRGMGSGDSSPKFGEDLNNTVPNPLQMRSIQPEEISLNYEIAPPVGKQLRGNRTIDPVSLPSKGGYDDSGDLLDDDDLLQNMSRGPISQVMPQPFPSKHKYFENITPHTRIFRRQLFSREALKRLNGTLYIYIYIYY